MPWRHAATSLLLVAVASFSLADQPKKVLLLGQARDHPPGSHEYMAGMRVLAKCLQSTPGLDLKVVRADEPWPEGAELLDGADGVVLYLGQGGRWIQNDPRRLKAMARLAARGGGIVALHWAIGAKEAKYIDPYRGLIGGIHGGPDRRYVILEEEIKIADPRHPIALGINDFRLRDEFYYQLKFAKTGTLRPILQVAIDGRPETVAWAYERPDGGRSFGFGGMHYHSNWELPVCRRLIAQGLLWTLKLPIPREGLAVEVPEETLKVE